MSGFISIYELHDIKKKKEKLQKEHFQIIADLCNKKIKNVAEHGSTNTFYTIPGLMLGLPLYNFEECIKYIITGLKKSGFFIQRLPHPNINIIYISWGHNDIKSKFKSITN